MCISGDFRPHKQGTAKEVKPLTRYKQLSTYQGGEDNSQAMWSIRCAWYLQGWGT